MSKKTETKKEMIDEDGVVYAELATSPFRTPYFNRPEREPMLFDPAEKRTKDEFKDECDTNLIWANFVKTGRRDQLEKAQGMYKDLVNAPQNYHESLNLVVHTREMFDSLPADIRNVFGNDIQAFMHAAADNPEGLFDVLKPLQAIDGSAATPLAPPKAEPPVEPPQGGEPPLQNPPK